MQIKLLFSIGLIFLVGDLFAQYTPADLRRLGSDERVEFVRKGIYTSDKTSYKDNLGNTISSAEKIDQIQFTFDYYVNSNNEIVECVLRRKNDSDRLLTKRIIEAAQERDWGSIQITNIDCENKKKLLEQVYTSDQENRKGRAEYLI